mmetsp:Transcript_25141/g.70233  ORF Transcript_25141/g.70233 Transcript_25141/m.70233 type:complete len:220 (+) Transcript_25141:1839-2498(+)
MHDSSSSSSSSSSAIACANSVPGDSATMRSPLGDIICCMPIAASICCRLRWARSAISALVLLRRASTAEAARSPPVEERTSSRLSARPPTWFSEEQPSRRCRRVRSSGRTTRLWAVAAWPRARAASKRRAAGTPGLSMVAAHLESRRLDAAELTAEGAGECGTGTGEVIGVEGLTGTDAEGTAACFPPAGDGRAGVAAWEAEPMVPCPSASASPNTDSR